SARGACALLCFSSRRRHTSFSRDWSSDVCSCDLTQGVRLIKLKVGERMQGLERIEESADATAKGELAHAESIEDDEIVDEAGIDAGIDDVEGAEDMDATDDTDTPENDE